MTICGYDVGLGISYRSQQHSYVRTEAGVSVPVVGTVFVTIKLVDIQSVFALETVVE